MKDGAGQAVDCYVRQLLVAIAAAFRSLLKSSHSAAEQFASKLLLADIIIIGRLGLHRGQTSEHANKKKLRRQTST